MQRIKWLIYSAFIGMPMLTACAYHTPVVTNENLPVVTVIPSTPPPIEQPVQAAPAPVEKTPIPPEPQTSIPLPKSSPVPKTTTTVMLEKKTVKKDESAALLNKPPSPVKIEEAVTNQAKPAELTHTPSTEPEPDIKMDLDALPITYYQWIVDYEVLPKSNHIQCSLRTKSLTMDDGEGGTPVYLSVGQRGVQAVTKSNIDLEYAGSGLQIDFNPQHGIDKVQRETVAVFEQDGPKIIEEMQSGQHAILTLGFWPTWPMTRTYSVTFEIGHFAAAWRALQTCQQQANEEAPIVLANKEQASLSIGESR